MVIFKIGWCLSGPYSKDTDAQGHAASATPEYYIQLFDYPIILVKWIFNNYNKAKVRDTCRLKQPYSSEIWRRYEYRKETIEKLKVAS